MIHSDHGTQPTFQAFTRRAIDSDLIPSTGSVGDRFDNAVIESFWSRIRVEILDRKRWRTRVELANALFAYLEILYDRSCLRELWIGLVDSRCVASRRSAPREYLW